jgi:prevent-host-death family protein
MSNLISVSDVSKNTSATIAKAASGITQIVLNHNKPVAAIVDIKLLEQLEEFLYEQEVLKIAEERMNYPRENGVTLDELRAEFGLSDGKQRD